MAFDKDVAGVLFQPRAVAIGTNPETEIAGQFGAHAIGVRFVVAAHDMRHDAFERLPSTEAHAAAAYVAKTDYVVPAAMQDDVLVTPVETLEGRGEIESVMPRKRFEF